MADDLGELRAELRAVAADILAKHRGERLDTGLLARAGWTGLEVPDALGGAGATFREVAVICEELGRTASCSGYLGGVVLGAGLLAASPAGGPRDVLLADIASGESTVAVACSGEHLPGAGAAFTVEETPAGPVLRGGTGYVPDACDADWILVPATGPSGGLLVAVPAPTEGLLVTAQPVVDETRSLAAVSAESVRVDTILALDDGAVFDRAAVAIACDSLGIGEAMLAATVDYACVREQFGRPIGSFQAVKHACADMRVRIAVARVLVDDAVNAITRAAPDASRAAAMAKSYACDAAVEIAGKAMQLHGGIGYTWESGIHVYLKRATLNRSLFGSPAAHRRRLTES